MRFNPEIHHRKSIRLKGYDYSRSGFYFLTICTQNRLKLFGEIFNGIVNLNKLGETVDFHWTNLPDRFPLVKLDYYIIMPNHIHGVIVIDDSDITTAKQSTLGQIVRFFKSKSAIAINQLLGNINQRLWQRNYYEHIIRNEEEHANICFYIKNNPEQWYEDEYFT